MTNQRNDVSATSCPLIAVFECEDDVTLTSSTGAATLSKSDVISTRSQASVTSQRLCNNVTSFARLNGNLTSRDGASSSVHLQKADATVRKTSAASLDKHFHFNESEFPTETNLMTNNGNDVSSSEIPTSPSLPVSCTSTATVNATGSLKRKPGRRSVPPPRRKTRASFSVASAHYPSTRRTLSFKDTRLVTSPSQNLLRVTSRASLNRRASLTPSLRRLQVRFAAQIEVGPKFERPKFQG